MMPGLLKKRNLSCNETKTECYSISRNGDEKYKKGKQLGNIIETVQDMKRRKALTTATMKTYNPIWKSKAVSLEQKL